MRTYDMSLTVTKHFRRMIRDDRGVTLVEYGIAITVAITLGAGTLALLAGQIGASLTRVGGLMP